MAASSAEVQFAQRLAANEKKTRDKALKKLRKYIRSRSATKAGLSEDDLIKLWKGLHYCMWMQDKPLLQEELGVHISRLIFSFATNEASMQFFKVFLITEAREWNGIDRLRMDKFMMLVRQMLNQTFVLVKQDGWKEEIIESLVVILNATVLNTATDNTPDSLNMHVADIFIPELTKVGWEQLDGQKILSFLKVFDNYLETGKRPSVLKRIYGGVFTTVAEQTAERVRQMALREAEGEGVEKEDGATEDSEDSDSGYDEDSEPRLKYDCEVIANHLFEIGSSEKCCSTNRQKIYNTVKLLRDAVSGTTTSTKDQGDDYDLDDDVEDAVVRLCQLNSVKKRRKRKHEDDIDDDYDEGDKEDDEDQEMETDVAQAPTGKPAKGKKKRKKKKKKPKLEDNTGDAASDKTSLIKSSSSGDFNVITKNTSNPEAPEGESPKKKKKKRRKKKKSTQDPSVGVSVNDGIGKGGNSETLKAAAKTASVSGQKGEGQMKSQTGELSSDKASKKKAKKKKLKESEQKAGETDVSPPKKIKTENQQTAFDKLPKQVEVIKDKTPKKLKTPKMQAQQKTPGEQISKNKTPKMLKDKTPKLKDKTPNIKNKTPSTMQCSGKNVKKMVNSESQQKTSEKLQVDTHVFKAQTPKTSKSADSNDGVNSTMLESSGKDSSKLRKKLFKSKTPKTPKNTSVEDTNRAAKSEPVPKKATGNQIKLKSSSKKVSDELSKQLFKKKTKTPKTPKSTSADDNVNVIESTPKKSSDKLSKQLFKDKTPTTKTSHGVDDLDSTTKHLSSTKKASGEQRSKGKTPKKYESVDDGNKSLSDIDIPLQKGEVEIWVPSKKYQNKGKAKEGAKVKDDQREGTVDKDNTKIKQKSKAKVSPGKETEVKSNMSEGKVEEKVKAKKKKAQGSAFAQFENISTPPAAFVKRAIAKAGKTPSKTPTMTPCKTPTKQETLVAGITPQLTASEKKVKFNMKKNTAQKFEDSMNISPLPPFVPEKSPCQGILKSPFLTTPTSAKRSGKKKNQKKMKSDVGSTPGSGKKALTRSHAADFF